MARIRTIKPEFWSDEKLSPLAPIDRLTFLGLISMADDYGRVHDNVKVIDAFIFPNTDDSVRESLANLSRMNRIRRGNSSSGMPIIEIINWDRHQKVDKPQPKLALPPIDTAKATEATFTNKNTGSNDIRESFENHSRAGSELVAPLTTDLRPTTYDHDHGSTIVSEQKNHSRIVRDDPPTVDLVAHYIASIGKDTGQAQKFCDYYAANGWVQGTEGKPIKDWQAQVRIWFSNEQSRNKNTRNNLQTFAKQREENTRQAIEEFVNGQ